MSVICYSILPIWQVPLSSSPVVEFPPALQVLHSLQYSDSQGIELGLFSESFQACHTLLFARLKQHTPNGGTTKLLYSLIIFAGLIFSVCFFQPSLKLQELLMLFFLQPQYETGKLITYPG